MSDYFDIIKSAKEKGILLDSCGTDDRQYWNGLYNDLCGMSVEDAMAVQFWHGEMPESKKVNTVIFTMEASGSEYELVLKPKYAPTADVNVSFVLDDSPYTVVIPSGSLSFSTGILRPTKYASLKNIALSSEDESYTYQSKSDVKDGNFTLTYISATGEIISTQSVKNGETVTLPDVPSEYQVGYDYYWHYQGSEEPISGTFVMPEQDVTIVGTAKIHVWTITYKISGETDVVKSYNYGATIKKYIPASKEGREFSGWDGEEPLTMPDNALTFNGQYIPLSYTLNYILDGEIYSSFTYDYDEIIVPIEDPEEKKGYTFSGWNEVPERMPAHNVDIIGKYVINTYTITYHIDGLEDVVKSYKFNETVTKYIPVMEGHTFDGWNEDEPATMPSHNIILNGTFTANVYTITYYIDSEVYLQEEHNFGAEITIASEPEKEGYTFSGWDEILPATMPSHNIDIHGAYTINSHYVIFYVDDKEFFKKSVNYGELVEAIAYPEKEGYTFGGWSDFPSDMPDHDVEIYGYFTVNSYTLTYYLEDTPYSSFTYEYGAEIVPIDEPEKEGYTFGGWNGLPTTMPANNVDVYGYFAINKYVLTYYLDGVKYAEKEYEYLSPIIPIDEPEKEGYTFGGWSEIPAVMPANNVNVEGSFSINTYTLTYIVDEETYSSETYEFGAIVEPIEAPAKEGYTFVKWNGIPVKMPAKDCTVIAIYNINEWVVTYWISGETEPYTSVTYEYGATIVDPVPPEKEGYTFAWDSHPATMPDNDIEINGKYSEIVESSTIYYGMMLHDSVSGLTPESISALTNYDGAEEKQKLVPAPIPASPECAEWAILRDEADDEGDEELALYYDSLIDTWKQEHQYAFVFAIPDNLSFANLKNEINVIISHQDVGTYTIGGTSYTLRKYTSNGLRQDGSAHTLKYKITLN